MKSSFLLCTLPYPSSQKNVTAVCESKRSVCLMMPIDWSTKLSIHQFSVK